MDSDTFSSALKEELCRAQIKGRAQAFWEAVALFRFLNQKGSGGREIKWAPRVSAKAFLLRRLFNLGKYAWGSNPSFRPAQSRGKLHRSRKSASGELWIDNLAKGSSLLEPPLEMLEANAELRRSFLRGAFLAKGYISSPNRDHHLEIALPLEKDALLVKSLLRKEGLNPGIVPRRSGWVVYLKDSDEITQLLKALGASRAVLEYENVRVQKELKASVQRLVNMDGANVSRTVNAAFTQVQDILVIDSEMGLGRLPKALRELAMLRLENPDLSMEELGKLLTPPASKSAVNHRFRRIAKIARDLKTRSDMVHPVEGGDLEKNGKNL